MKASSSLSAIADLIADVEDPLQEGDTTQPLNTQHQSSGEKRRSISRKEAGERRSAIREVRDNLDM